MSEIDGELSLFSLWAKTHREPIPEVDVIGSPAFHPLIYHSLDVAACAEALFRQERRRTERLAQSCGVDIDVLCRCFVALIALHDIGKCAFGFQRKVPHLWPDFFGPLPKAPVSVRHDAAGVWLFTKNAGLANLAKTLLPDICPSTRIKLLQAVCAHHGEPVDWRNHAIIGINQKTIGAKAQDAAVTIAAAMIKFFKPVACRFDESNVPLVSFWLAGLTVLADWLGSNRTWFDFHPVPQSGDLASNIATYMDMVARPGAERAMSEAGLRSARISSQTGLHYLFDDSYNATPLQNYAETVVLDDGPLLFIIEDMTGAGKTEAAVILAHRMMQKGSDGLHVALPTMATANAMFERLAQRYRLMFERDDVPSIVLTHGRRELFEGFRSLPGSFGTYVGNVDDEEDPSQVEASAFCADWLARSNKQAFLAQVGAGTVDQALLAVLPARHQSLRLWGLGDKVLVIDEAHAYDAYMGVEIERLLEFHAAFGGSAIVLSATLPQTKRQALMNAFLRGAKRGETDRKVHQSAYPLVTSICVNKIEETPLALRKDLERKVEVEQISALDDAHARALEAARRGAAVAVIRNTVDEAIASYEVLAGQFADVMLFHARFAMCDRQKIEAEVLRRFGKDGDKKRNTILVATQVIEQSLDLDFDLLVSDLAPVDLLIQRAGRLWRHNCRLRPIAGPRFCVLSPEPTGDAGPRWLDTLLPKANAIYDVAVMWRSAKALFTAGKIVSCTSSECAPVETGEIRALVEAVYGEDKLLLPPSLIEPENEATGKASGEKTMARFTLLNLGEGYDWSNTKWERDTKIKTRLGDETIILRLARINEGRVVPWAEVEGGDMRRAWALSEVSVRKSRCSGSHNAPEVEKLIEKAQHDWTLSEKAIPVVVLLKLEDAQGWSSVALGPKNKGIEISYSHLEGLKFQDRKH